MNELTNTRTDQTCRSEAAMNVIIETMANALADTLEHGDTFYYVDDVVAILRAAKAGGWELCKLPEPMEGVSTYDDGWNDCLDEIERLKLEGES